MSLFILLKSLKLNMIIVKNITALIKKKIFSIYVVFGFVLFMILFSFNYFYNENVLNLRLGNQYKVYADQYDNYKREIHKDLLKYIFRTKFTTLHRVKDVNVPSYLISFKEKKSQLSFTLVLNDFVDRKKLEDTINEEYIGRLKKNIRVLEENFHIYDYKSVINSKNEARNNEIEKEYNKLINSDFAKKYPVAKCYQTKENCLKKIRNYYIFVLENLTISNADNVRNFLSMKKNEKYSISEIYNDFNSNLEIYNGKKLFNLLEGYGEYEEDFFENKLTEFEQSQFYKIYSINEICNDKARICFRKVSDKLNKIKYIHEKEVKLPWKVQYLLPLEEKQEFKLIIQSTKILIFTLLITYILFILTNKFLTRKLK